MADIAPLVTVEDYQGALGEDAVNDRHQRFEEQVAIVLRCCNGSPMKLAGNLSLREAGADATRLGYECKTCSRRVMVSDSWGPTTPEIAAAHDREP